jgi:hypothetical protein
MQIKESLCVHDHAEHVTIVVNVKNQAMHFSTQLLN